MGVKIDLHYWTKKYEDDYPIEATGKYPLFIDEKGVEHEERSQLSPTPSATSLREAAPLELRNWKTLTLKEARLSARRNPAPRATSLSKVNLQFAAFFAQA